MAFLMNAVVSNFFNRGAVGEQDVFLAFQDFIVICIERG